jgi:dephospho-CoA kinase
MAIRVFGLTGGVASGKSSVSRLLRARGVEVVDADEVARAVVEPGSEGLREVVACFGDEVLRADGSLDRPRLGKLVFAEPERRAELNGILHPRIAAETQRRIASLERRGVMLACYDAALLVENGLADAFRPLVVVALDAEAQVARLCARDGIDEPAARQRLQAQFPLHKKVAEADVVIDNGGTLEQLEARVDEALERVRALVAASPS